MLLPMTIPVLMFKYTLCSLSRLAAPLDSMMRDKLSSSNPEANEWFWSDQVPPAVTSFVSCFEGDQRFVAATSEYVISLIFILVSYVKH